jgi:hypothetical protein
MMGVGGTVRLQGAGAAAVAIGGNDDIFPRGTGFASSGVVIGVVPAQERRSVR